MYKFLRNFPYKNYLAFFAKEEKASELAFFIERDFFKKEYANKTGNFRF